MNLDNISENHIPEGLGSALPLHKLQKKTDSIDSVKNDGQSHFSRIDKADMSTLSRIMAKGADALEEELAPRPEVVERFKNFPNSPVAFSDSIVERIFKKIVG